MNLVDLKRLEAFQRNADQKAFEALVHQYLPMVHAVAMRISPGRSFSEDVAQMVFAKLAATPAVRFDRVPIPVWLHGEARSAMRGILRSEKRRMRREQISIELKSVMETPWEKLSPLIDEAIGRLSKPDQQAIIGRFFDLRSHSDISAMLGVSPEAARMRINRALERLKAILQRKGIATSAGALEVALSGNAAAVPTISDAMVRSVASSACSAASGTLKATSWIHFITMTTVQKSGAVALLLVTLVPAGVYVLKPGSEKPRSSTPAVPATSVSGNIPDRPSHDESRERPVRRPTSRNKADGMNLDKIDARNRQEARDSARVKLSEGIQRISDELGLSVEEVDELRTIADDRLELFDGDVPVGSHGFRNKTLQEMKALIEKEESVTLDSVAYAALRGKGLEAYKGFRDRDLDMKVRVSGLRQLQASGLASTLEPEAKELLLASLAPETKLDLQRGGDEGIRSLILDAAEKNEGSNGGQAADVEASRRMIGEEAVNTINRKMKGMEGLLDSTSLELYRKFLEQSYQP